MQRASSRSDSTHQTQTVCHIANSDDRNPGLFTMTIILATLVLTILLRPAHSCSITNRVKVTFFGFPDNDPAGPATAYDCSNRNNIAGGTGTYSDPLTFASDSSEYTPCELVYSSYLKKYLRMEDSCDECGKRIWTSLTSYCTR